jgi:GTP-binding protein
LIRETRSNVSLEVNDTGTAGAFEINARGEMQIAILVEQMRRESYEVMVSRPEVIFHRAENGNLLEPLENLYVDLPSGNLGDVLQRVASRKGERLINDGFSVLLGTACDMIGAISFFKNHFRFLKEIEANLAFRL